MSSAPPVFDTLLAFHAYADAHAHEFQHLPSLGTIAQHTRDRLITAGNTAEASSAQIEVDALSFDLRDGDLASMFSGSDTTGKLVEYPDPKTFTDARRSYLYRRLQDSNNPALLARYAHVLWKSRERKIEHAHRAIDSYLDSIEPYVQEDSRYPDQHFGLTVSQAIVVTFRIALSINDSERINRCKHRLVDLVSDLNSKSTSRHNLIFDLTQFAFQNRKRMSDTIHVLASELYKEYDLNYSNSDYHGAIQIAELSQKSPSVRHDRTKLWHRRIADCYEQLAKRATDPQNPVSPHFYAESIRHYRLGGASKKTLRRLTHEHERAVRQVRYGQISVEVDLSKYADHCKKQADLVVQEGEDFIVRYLMIARFLIPPRKEIEGHISADAQRHALLATIPVTINDHLGRQAQHFSEADERSYASLLRHYPWWLTTRTLMMLRELLFETIRRDALSKEAISKLLRQHSWIGTDMSRGDSRIVASSPVTWLDLIMPGIEHYFDQVRRTIQDPEFQPNFVLAVDSLVPKIEGMIRDLCRLSGGVTVNMTTDNRNRTVQREKDLHSLLYEEVVMNLLDEDDLLFFRFLFVEQAGYDLRNRVAHGLTNREHYTLEYALFTLLAVFRLARYEMKIEPTEPSSDESG